MATDQEIRQGVTEVFHEVFADDTLKLTPQMNSANIAGWDSIKMVTIIISVEQKFGIKMRSIEVDQLRSVGDLFSLVKTKLS